MSDFKNKTIIITGAAMGLGLSTAEVLADAGANLVLVDYNEEALQKAKADIEGKYATAKVLAVTADVSNEEAVKKYVDAAVNEFGTIDGFYNNAGIEGLSLIHI